MTNHGVILEQIPQNIGYIGGIADDLPVLLESGDWEPYLPEFEGQSKWGLSTMNCVQFSRLNACEMQASFHGKPLNLSDRFLYWASGCTPRGNTFIDCDHGLKRCGCSMETTWPWLGALTREQYGMNPPQYVKDEAKKLLDEWDIGMLRWVPKDLEKMKEALKRTPLWFCNSGHAMVIYRIDDRLRVFDTFGTGLGSFPLEYVSELRAIYNAPFVPRTNIIEKPMSIAPENSLVAVVDGLGGRYMYANGKLYADDAGKINLELKARNSKECPEVICTHGEEYIPHRVAMPVPIVHLETKDIEGVEIVNLKGEKV